MTVLTWALQAFLLYLGATFVFDLAHWALHAFHRSSWKPLQAIGALHHTHHRFLGPGLQFDDSFIASNLWRHRTGELFTQLLGASVGFAFLHPAPVVAVLAIFTGSFAVGLFYGGKDSNHRQQVRLRAPLGAVFVGLPYHSLHHAFPNRYFGSVTTAFDRLFGTGCQVAGRRVVITGASGAFGAPLKKLLEAQGAIVTALKHGVDFDAHGCSSPALAAADILVLAHGSKGPAAMTANCDTFLLLIDRFRQLTRGRLVAPEVWAVGSEIECHPSFGNPDAEVYLQSKRAFARQARRLFHEDDLLYRHIVPSAFTSPLGPGLISGEFAAAWAWFLIKRGCRYVPVSYTGIALINYLKFVLRVHAPPPKDPCS